MGLGRVFIHAILDGRDTPPKSGSRYIEKVQAHIDKHDFGTIATICGRYFAMDRDNRWERVQKAHRLYTRGEGALEIEPQAAVINAYQKGETDEFVRPIVITDEIGSPKGVIQDGDGIMFFNFRADRAREITRALTDGAFDAFERKPNPRLCGYVCMTSYDEKFTLPVAFEPVHMQNILGEIISRKHLRQLRIAETEKYAHVTYFFNGGEETPFQGEDRCLIPSPKDVATYDQKPEMSAHEVTREVKQRIASETYDFIVLNFANMDMVGHTGVLEAAIKACETVDACVDEIIEETRKRGWAAILTADHGNSEKMIDDDGSPHTAHTVGKVRFILVDDTRKDRHLREGSLCDIAPTILEIMQIEQPEEMTGRSLIVTRNRVNLHFS
jgi:2,3-bisphosphoglycerate-independent phosphoglycerate mutase